MTVAQIVTQALLLCCCSVKIDHQICVHSWRGKRNTASSFYYDIHSSVLISLRLGLCFILVELLCQWSCCHIYGFIESVILPDPSVFIFMFKPHNPFHCCVQAISPALSSAVTVRGIASHSGTAIGSTAQRNLIYRSQRVSDTLCTPRGADLLNAL